MVVLFCCVTEAIASCPNRIRKGFDLEKDIEEVIAFVTKLESEGKLNLKTSSEKHRGITHFPLKSGYLKSNHVIQIHLLKNKREYALPPRNNYWQQTDIVSIFPLMYLGKTGTRGGVRIFNPWVHDLDEI